MTEDIKKACEVMAAGGIILYPTDTIWGIGCDATNEKAVQRVYELKRRTDNKAMLVLMDSEAKLDRYVSDVPDIAWDLISVSDKPLTIITQVPRTWRQIYWEPMVAWVSVSRTRSSPRNCASASVNLWSLLPPT